MQKPITIEISEIVRPIIENIFVLSRKEALINLPLKSGNIKTKARYPVTIIIKNTIIVPINDFSTREGNNITKGTNMPTKLIKKVTPKMKFSSDADISPSNLL